MVKNTSRRGFAMNVCGDPGHGGKDSGAVGPTGLRESDAALSILMLIRHGIRLMPGWEMFCTRTDDRYLTLQERCDIANSNGADLLLSVHCNAVSNPLAHGFEVFTSPGQTAADPIAERIFESISAAFPNLAPRLDKADGDSDKEAKYRVLIGTKMPAVLVECCFISNSLEERWLRDMGWKMRMAGAILSGLAKREVFYA